MTTLQATPPTEQLVMELGLTAYIYMLIYTNLNAFQNFTKVEMVEVKDQLMGRS